MKVFTRQEVAGHNTIKDFWIIIDNLVYDITKFYNMHPGGSVVLRGFAGKDVTKDFFSLHKTSVLEQYGPRLCVGSVAGATAPPTDGIVPYSQSSYWCGWKSPHYNESHSKFRDAVRKIVAKVLKPVAMKIEKKGADPPKEIFLKLGEVGILACRLGPGPHLKDFNLPGGVDWKDFDYFHEQILHEELAAIGTPGFFDGLGTGMVIGLPCVMNYAKEPVRSKVVSEVLSGRKTISLAITEPFAGSDVAGMRATAEKSPCGKYYIVNGVKKWITNGSYTDYFSTAVKTDNGVSLLLIERGEGVETKKIITSYSPSAGTAYIEFDNVKVPVENLLGVENDGFKAVMTNFNHERWYICVYVIRFARLMTEECFKWANQRMVFGKRLIDQPVIRNKLATMVSEVEGVSNWLENVTYQMNTMTSKEQVRHLAGGIALLKLKTTKMAYIINDNACQIFGGRAITASGMGDLVEKFTRFVKFAAIYGGSEEIMADLGIRQCMKYFPKHARL